MSRYYYVYIITSDSGTLYIGVTNNLTRRVWEHKTGQNEGFTKKYNCHRLIYYECCESVSEAILREKQLKRWNREKKEKLIKGFNPQWLDLGVELLR